VNILIVRPDGIGDEILALPVATALRGFLPDARLIFLSSAYAAPVLRHHPDVDEILTLEGGESLRDLVRLFRSGIHAALFLKPFRKLVVAAWLAGVPLRVGTGYRWYSWLLNRRVYEHRSDFSKHESLYNLGLLKGLGLSPGDVAPPPRLIITPEEHRWAVTFLGPPTTRIVVHPGGFSSRTWRAAQFRDLVWRLARDGYEILLTGSQAEGERFRSETGMTECPAGVRDLMGTLSLRELMAVMAESQAVVSMSSGPMHLAAALGVPTISLFDPRRNQSPVRWQPLGRGVVLMPDVPTCEKCIYEACPYWDCLDRITVETVLQRIQQVLAPGPSAPLAVGRV
jgi:ADP-heptose:LPS heptosyltransferase